MRSLLKTLLPALCGAWFLLAPASAQTDPAAAEALVKQCGLWEQLGSLQAQVKGGLLQAAQASPRKATPQELARFEQVALAAYDPTRMRRLTVAAVAAHLDPAAVASVNAWYASAAGARLTAAEEASAREARSPPAALAAGRALLEAMPEARLALLQRVMSASRAVEVTVQMLMNSVYAIQRGLRAADPDLPGGSAAELRGALEAQRPRFTQLYGELLRSSFAVSYQAVSDADLAAYGDFLTSKHGEHFNGVAVAALGSALDDAAEEVGRNLVATTNKASS